MEREQLRTYMLDKVKHIERLYKVSSFKDDRWQAVREFPMIISHLRQLIYNGIDNMTNDDLLSNDKTSQALINFDILLKDTEQLAFKKNLRHSDFESILSQFCPRFPFC